jgi:hypothetical protein
MIVMVANNSGWDAGVLYGRYPDRVGHLYSPGAERRPNFMPPYALDNGRFAARGGGWDEVAFLRLVETHGSAARWVVVPDVVGDRDGTLREWGNWAHRLNGLTLALAVQDGMTAADVPVEASVIFVGGTTIWKRRTLFYWPAHFPRVHVGRINTERWLWECDHAGVESCDGTGWLRGDKRQFRGLERYLDRCARGIGPIQGGLFSSDSAGGDSDDLPRTGILPRCPAEPGLRSERPEHHITLGEARGVA